MNNYPKIIFKINKKQDIYSENMPDVSLNASFNANENSMALLGVIKTDFKSIKNCDFNDKNCFEIRFIENFGVYVFAGRADLSEHGYNLPGISIDNMDNLHHKLQKFTKLMEFLVNEACKSNNINNIIANIEYKISDNNKKNVNFDKKTRQLAIYGKGGIGKSTVSSNLTAALSCMGISSAQIGCDPKSDSVNTLVGGKFIETIADLTREFGESENSLNKAIYKGFNNILCMEAGGPVPGQGCAGRGVLVALDLIKKYKIFEENNIDLAVYDVLGDIVCGGFAQPIRHGFSKEVYIVTSGEYMALYAANNIAASIKQFYEQGLDVGIGGIIANLRNIENEREIIENFAEKIKVPVIQFIPRSDFVQKAEMLGKTVVEALFNSDQTQIYLKLAEKILNNQDKYIPEPVSRTELIDLLRLKQEI